MKANARKCFDASTVPLTRQISFIGPKYRFVQLLPARPTCFRFVNKTVFFLDEAGSAEEVHFKKNKKISNLFCSRLLDQIPLSLMKQLWSLLVL